MKNQLVLYCQLPVSKPVSRKLVHNKLLEIGLISAINAPTNTVVFPTGLQFNNLVSFVGCSPILNLDSEQAENEFGLAKIEIEIPQASNEEYFLFGENTRAPKCPICSTTINAWRSNLTTDYLIRCSHCNSDIDLKNLAWGKYAAYTCFYIAINGIYQREAIPLDSFLKSLELVFNAEVKYCYLQNRSKI